MTFAPPDSSAMDATAASGGPITILPQIVTGSPEQIAAHVEQLLAKAEQFLQLVNQFEQARTQLEQAWSGSASQSASKKITASLQSFEKIITVIEQGAGLLGQSGTLVQSAQTAYQTVVSATNPTVASLMSNPWTYSAAVALSTATSGTLRGYITGVQAVLQALGAGQIGQQISTLLQIIGEIEQLAGGSSSSGGGSTATGSSSTGGPGSTGGTTPTDATISATPVTNPGPPASVASASGQQAVGAEAANGGQPTAVPGITSYTPAALSGLTGAGAAPTAAGPTGAAYPAGSYPTTGAVPAGAYAAGSYPTAGAYPSAGAYPTTGAVPGGYESLNGAGAVDPNTSWIAVDPSAATTAGAPPTGGGALPATGQEVTLQAHDGALGSTIEVPAGHDVDVTLDVTMDGLTLHEHGHIAADGTVSS